MAMAHSCFGSIAMRHVIVDDIMFSHNDPLARIVYF